MKKRVHIAKRLAGLFSSLGGVRGGFFLLTTILLLAGTRYAHAQNTSAEPYINSWHKYHVPFGDAGNTFVWQISNTNYDSGNPITLTDGLSEGGEVWVRTGNEPSGTPTHTYIEIKFVNDIFEGVTDPWILRYEEHDAGGGGCIAVRELEINPTVNLFNLAVEELVDDCNSFAGLVWDNTDDLTIDRTMAVSFTVNMSKALTHAVSEYTFTATVSKSSDDFSIPAAANDFIAVANQTGSSSFGSFAIENINTSTGTFEVRVYNLSGTEYDTDDQVKFTINLRGPAIYDLDVTLKIENGKAVSGTNYKVVTDENSTTDNDETHTLWGIPNTSIVSVSP